MQRAWTETEWKEQLVEARPPDSRCGVHLGMHGGHYPPAQGRQQRPAQGAGNQGTGRVQLGLHPQNSQPAPTQSVPGA